MQIFELHFNPKLKEEQIFDSFIYEPENIYEKKLGSLYIVGELKNVLPQNSNFLDNLAKEMKKNYYRLSFNSSEKALSESLKRANEFLAQEVKRDNVSWLGNLNFAVLALKDFNLIFTKTGEIKILLIRAEQIIDIGKNLDFSEIEPYPLKIFFNVVSGKLILNDIILVLTKDIFEFFIRQNLLAKISQVENLNSKKIKEILPSSFINKEGSKISGVCLISVIKSESQLLKIPREIIFQKKEKFSFAKIFLPMIKPFKKAAKIKLLKVNKVSKFLRNIWKWKKLSLKIFLIKMPKIVTKINLSKEISLFRIKKIVKVPAIKKKLILIITLIFLLLLGFLIFRWPE